MPLSQRRVLVVEDSVEIAREISHEVALAGGSVVGPAASVDGALALIEWQPLDVAVLDINLNGEMVFPVADALAEAGTPALFVTSYDTALIPRRFAQYAACDKTWPPGRLGAVIRAAMAPPWQIGIGASGAEGIRDVGDLLGALPADLNAVLMVTVHRPWEKTSELAQVLQTWSALPVSVARSDQRLQPGHVYIGEPSRHLALAWRGRAALHDDAERRFRNRTVDLLFDSLAARGAGRTMGVILSGALDDGARGLAALRASGGLALTVEPGSKVERGMAASAAARLGAADFVGAPRAIASRITAISRAQPQARLLAA